MATPSKIIIGGQEFPALNVGGLTVIGHAEPVFAALKRPWDWDQARSALVFRPWDLPESWVALAGRMAKLAGGTEVERRVICHTVECESNGDNGAIEWETENGKLVFDAYGHQVVGGSGYGQVWPLWHVPEIVTAMQLLGRPPLPARYRDNQSETTHSALVALLLYDRELSMLTVALICRDLWRRVGGDWDRFTEGYVGSGIPGTDRERRRAIWQRWQAA